MKAMSSFSKLMKHIHLESFGEPSVMTVKSSALPELSQEEVLIQVKSIGINRADTLQRKGKYPAPPGHSPILGLECAGYLPNEQKVMALLSGGGYAQFAKVKKSHVMSVPDSVSITEAGGLVEVWLTAFQLLVSIARVQAGETVMVYAGASGVGTAAIQLCKSRGVTCFVTVSTQEKADFCEKLGAAKAYNYKELTQEAILADVRQRTDNKGVQVILDCVGPSFFDLGVKLCGTDARWVQYGLMSGVKQEVNLAQFLGKRIQLLFSTLRSRSDDYKTQLIEDFSKEVLPGFEKGDLKVVVDQVLEVDWEEEGVESKFQQAHVSMEANANKGKILLVYK